jgi:hypothetical protein
VVKVDGGKLLKLRAELVSEFVDHECQEVLYKLKIVYEDLEKILNPNFLVGLELELQISLTLKNFFVFCVLH